jgi:acyl carrier protein
MIHANIRIVLLEKLIRIAPDLDTESIMGEDHLQDHRELDSMDTLNLVIAPGAMFGIQISEKDYPRFAEVDLAVTYLAESLGH